MHQGLLSWEQGHSVEKGMKHSRTAEHPRCHSFPSCKCIILLSPITGGQSSSSPQQFIHHCRADHFISQKLILVYRRILSSSSVIRPQSLDKSFIINQQFTPSLSQAVGFFIQAIFTGTYPQASALFVPG